MPIKLGSTSVPTIKLGTTAITKVYLGTTLTYLAADPPSAPQSLTGVGGDAQVALSWSAPASDGGAAITGYKIYQSTDNVSFSEVTTVTGTSHTVTGLANNTTYYFKVAAVNVGSTGSDSNTVGPITPLSLTQPSAPTNLYATPLNQAAALSWDTPANNGGAELTEYRIYKSEDGGSTYTHATTAFITFGTTSTGTPYGGSGASQTITGLTNGTNYLFKVSAKNTTFEGPQSAASGTVTPTTGNTPPGIPSVSTNSLTHGDTRVHLSWQQFTTGGSSISYYEVYQSTDDITYTKVQTPTVKSATITGLTNGTLYYFRVAAVNALGAGPLSSSRNLRGTPSTLPDPPTSVSGTNGNTESTISWTAPANNGGAAITHYSIKCGPTSGFPGNATPYEQAGTGTTYTKTGLTNGVEYSVQVASKNLNGTGTYSSTSTFTPAVPTAPGVPQNLASFIGDQSVALSWDAPASDGGATITGYIVYQSTDNATFTQVATPSGTSHTVTGLTNGTAYYFKVAAVNSVGTGTQTSSTGSRTPAAGTAPSQVGTVTPTAGDTQVALSWSAPNAPIGSPITDYVIEFSTDNATFTTFNDGTTTGTSATVTGLTNGTQYYFRVSAVNSIGTGTASSSVTATPSAPGVPGAPQSPAATRGDTQVALSWSAPSSDGGSTITGYKVYQSTDDVSFTEVATPSGTSQTITSLTNGTTYYFKIAAVNSTGTGAQTSSVSAVPATTPAAPTSVSGTNGDTESVISWTAPTDTGGAAITGYKIKCGATSGYPGNATVYHQQNTNTTYTKTGLTNGTQYSIQVAAVNDVGDGAYSSTATATPAAVPTAPAQVGTVTTSPGNTQVTLSWSAPNNGGSAITDYVIEHSTDNATFTTFSDGTSTATSATVTGLTNGTQYYFRVSAVNAIGTGTASSSVTATPSAGATAPGVPQSFAASRGNTQVDLSWSAPASDGGATITGYKVYQSTDDASYSEVATPSGTTQTITSLTNGTTYYFKVAAVNSVGTGTQTSSVSAVPATTPGVPQSLAASHGNAQVDLTWSAPASNGGTAVTGYKVYQSTDNASFSEVATPSGTSQTVTSLTNGTQYYFKVAAVNAVGTGSQTSSVNATPATTPAAPTSLAATNGDTQSVLTWTAPTNTGGSAITGYKVKWGVTSGFPGNAAIISTGSTNATYTKTSLTNGTQYSFQVAAINAEGDGTYSSTATATPAASGSGITPNTDGNARFYLPASQTTFKVSANTSTGYFKVSSPGQSDVIGQEYTATGPTYYAGGTTAVGSVTMSGLSSSATKTVTVSPCNSSGTVTGNIIGIDIGSDSTNNITAVDLSGLTSLSTFHAGATGGSPAYDKYAGGGPVGTRSMVSSIEEVRAVNCDFSASNGYTSPYGPTTVYANAGGWDVSNHDMDATALNQMYTDLSGGTGGGGIFVGGNPGTGSDNPSIASNYSIHGS